MKVIHTTIRILDQQVLERSDRHHEGITEALEMIQLR